MAAAQNHWKLGLFVVVGLALAGAAGAFLGARSLHREVAPYVSYFDESVQGLDVGSPIKFRGVTIGTVGKIQIAPDHRHVEVESELGLDELSRLGLDVAESSLPFVPRKLRMAPELRLQMAQTGLTGTKFLQLDFFDVNRYPAPTLPFKVPENHIPTAPSTMKNLEDTINRMAERLPQITEQLGAVVDEVKGVVHQFAEKDFPGQFAHIVGTVDRLFTVVEQRITQLDTTAISQKAQKMMTDVNTAVNEVNAILARVNGTDGLLSRVERIGNSLGDILHDANGVGGQVIDTLDAVQRAARLIGTLADELERDPDMLLKGRSPEKKR